MTLTKTSLVLLLCFLGFYSETVKSQNCGCSPDLCCSQFGFCGTGNDYCGPGCQSVGITNRAGSDCAGKGFYTRDAFINAANTFPSFANSVTSLEIATMFAHFTQEVGSGKNYYGRGPIQLSWNYNYAPCGQSLGLDLLSQPELVGSDPTVAFRTALWFWVNNVRPVLSQGFGATIRAINGKVECDGASPDKVNFMD
ncbi:hypothetical protein DY000_02001857 [Brassica cretica]|uniref:Chitin-binding type-1 domain-containing protein n=1 Tax=Brassica cretica TaxID=69181 RepID=A0ABQ7C9U3_BRACR|nr:hypothetical protein DY000_02001857 [Brassica cretica]